MRDWGNRQPELSAGPKKAFHTSVFFPPAHYGFATNKKVWSRFRLSYRRLWLTQRKTDDTQYPTLYRYENQGTRMPLNTDISKTRVSVVRSCPFLLKIATFSIKDSAKTLSIKCQCMDIYNNHTSANIENIQIRTTLTEY